MVNSDFQIALNDIARCPRCKTGDYLRVGHQHMGQWLLGQLQERERNERVVDFQHCHCTCGWQGLVAEVVINHGE